MSKFALLPYETLSVNTQLKPALEQRSEIRVDDEAILLMTDFNNCKLFSVSSTELMDFANAKMIHCGVRLLFVSDNETDLLGIITAEDILGDRPINYISQHKGGRGDILVRDIMTPITQLEAVNIRQVERSSIGDIVKTIQNHGRQHIVVYEQDETRAVTVRGLFSSTQLERVLGISIPLVPTAHSFAEVENALCH